MQKFLHSNWFAAWLAATLCVLALGSSAALGQGPSLLPGGAYAPPGAPLPPWVEPLPSGAAPAPAPQPPPEVQAEILPGESFVTEDYWMPWLGWDGSVELGLSGNTGNSEGFNVRAGLNVSRKTERTKLGLEISYNNASSDGVETKHNALLNLSDEIMLGESPWTLFGKLGLEYDEFKAFDLRLSVSGGLGYRFIKTEATTLTGRFGAGTSREFGGPDDEWSPEAVFGIDFERQLSKMQKLTAKVEYLPEWTDFEQYRIVSDVAWVIALDEPQNLSLKISVNDQYDSTPNGLEPNDVNYSVLLLWKF